MHLSEKFSFALEQIKKIKAFEIKHELSVIDYCKINIEVGEW